MARNVSPSICLLDVRELWASMRSSWVNKSDYTVNLELSGIMFWVIKAGSREEAIALSLAWNSGKMKYPTGQGAKAL